MAVVGKLIEQLSRGPQLHELAALGVGELLQVQVDELELQTHPVLDHPRGQHARPGLERAIDLADEGALDQLVERPAGGREGDGDGGRGTEHDAALERFHDASSRR